MTHENLYPLTFVPVYKDYLWGGDRIARRYGRAGTSATCAESWEIADRPDGMSVVVNGPLAGASLRTLVQEFGARLLGTAVPSPVFPLLIKIIDPRQRLSLQVHPNEKAARATGGEPKTEMWFVLEADPDARVFTGLKPGTTADLFQKALSNRRLEEILQSVALAAGDAVFIPAGRVHAVDAGSLLLEIQQNSNTVYRVHDWDRTGPDGKPRELHLAQALKSIHWDDGSETPAITTQGGNDVAVSCDRAAASGRAAAGRAMLRSEATQAKDALALPVPPITGALLWQEVLSCPYFRLERLTFGQPLTCRNDGRSFHALFAWEGETQIAAAGMEQTMAPGSSWLLPAGMAEYRLVPGIASARLLRISVPA